MQFVARGERLAVALVDEELVDEETDKELDAFLVTSPTNIRYLTGFSGSAGMLLVTLGAPASAMFLATDGRYQSQATAELVAAGVKAEVSIGTPPLQLTALAEAAARSKAIGFEADQVSFALYGKLSSDDVFGPGRLRPVRSMVEKLRIVKDAGEQARMARAAEIADAAFASVIEHLGQWVRERNGVTEAEVAAELDHEMRRRGASEPAFETIVASGANAAMPHHRAAHDRIEAGRPIVFDFGATVEGYRSDMSRTVCVGEPRGYEERRMLEVVSASQAAGVTAVRAGVETRAVDSACRAVIKEAGWGDAFVHGTGHGVGLDIHEAPWVGTTSEDALAEGTVVTVEPGVYLPGTGGVRIEDMVVVTADGCELLTRAPKTPIIA